MHISKTALADRALVWLAVEESAGNYSRARFLERCYNRIKKLNSGIRTTEVGN